MVNWSCSSGSKSFCTHYFIFNYVLKPLFSKLTLFWPGEWNKKKVDCKHNSESRFGQVTAGLYPPRKAICCSKDPHLDPCKAGQISENADAHRVAVHASGVEASDKQGHFMEQDFDNFHTSAIIANLFTSSSLFVFGMGNLAKTEE